MKQHLIKIARLKSRAIVIKAVSCNYALSKIDIHIYLIQAHYSIRKSLYIFGAF